MDNINKFHTNGYDILTNEVPRETIDYLKSYTLELKNRMISNPQFEKNTKPNGTGTYGRFHDMASSSPLADDSENKKLFNVYTSQLMYEICKFYLMREKFYLFNDQVVVKLPKEPFHFEPHKDNQFGPNGPFPNRWDLKTLNCMIVLDDINDKNGGFKVKNRNTLQWDDLKLLQGDVLVMDGETFHQSGDNDSDLPRRVYICHYSTEPIGKNFKRGFYFKRFYGEHSKI